MTYFIWTFTSRAPNSWLLPALAGVLLISASPSLVHAASQPNNPARVLPDALHRKAVQLGLTGDAQHLYLEMTHLTGLTEHEQYAVQEWIELAPIFANNPTIHLWVKAGQAIKDQLSANHSS